MNNIIQFLFLILIFKCRTTFLRGASTSFPILLSRLSIKINYILIHQNYSSIYDVIPKNKKIKKESYSNLFCNIFCGLRVTEYVNVVI